MQKSRIIQILLAICALLTASLLIIFVIRSYAKAKVFLSFEAPAPVIVSSDSLAEFDLTLEQLIRLDMRSDYAAAREELFAISGYEEYLLEVHAITRTAYARVRGKYGQKNPSSHSAVLCHVDGVEYTVILRGGWITKSNEVPLIYVQSISGHHWWAFADLRPAAELLAEQIEEILEPFNAQLMEYGSEGKVID